MRSFFFTIAIILIGVLIVPLNNLYGFMILGAGFIWLIVLITKSVIKGGRTTHIPSKLIHLLEKNGGSFEGKPDGGFVFKLNPSPLATSKVESLATKQEPKE